MPVLLQAHAGAQETLRQGDGACQGTNLTAKRGLKAPFVAKFGVHLEKRSLVARGGGCGFVWGSKKKSHVALGGCGVIEKKRARGGGGPPRVGEGGSPRGFFGGSPEKFLSGPQGQIHFFFRGQGSKKKIVGSKGPNPPFSRSRPPSPTRGDPPPLRVVDPPPSPTRSRPPSPTRKNPTVCE